jgi:hypothetical protein
LPRQNSTEQRIRSRRAPWYFRSNFGNFPFRQSECLAPIWGGAADQHPGQDGDIDGLPRGRTDAADHERGRSGGSFFGRPSHPLQAQSDLTPLRVGLGRGRSFSAPATEPPGVHRRCPRPAAPVSADCRSLRRPARVPADHRASPRRPHLERVALQHHHRCALGSIPHCLSVLSARHLAALTQQASAARDVTPEPHHDRRSSDASRSARPVLPWAVVFVDSPTGLVSMTSFYLRSVPICRIVRTGAEAAG